MTPPQMIVTKNEWKRLTGGFLVVRCDSGEYRPTSCLIAANSTGEVRSRMIARSVPPVTHKQRKGWNLRSILPALAPAWFYLRRVLQKAWWPIWVHLWTHGWT